MVGRERKRKREGGRGGGKSGDVLGHKVAGWTDTHSTQVALKWSQQPQTGGSAAARCQPSLPARTRRCSTAPSLTASLRTLSWPLTTARSSCGKCPGAVPKMVLTHNSESCCTCCKLTVCFLSLMTYKM